MPEPLSVLATTAVALVAPYLTEAGKGAANKVGETAAGGIISLWQRARGRLTDAGAAAKVEKFEAAPDDERRRTILAGELEEVLEADASFAEELRRLVVELQPQTAATQSASIAGNNNNTVQIQGSGNSVSGVGHGRAS